MFFGGRVTGRLGELCLWADFFAVESFEHGNIQASMV